MGPTYVAASFLSHSDSRYLANSHAPGRSLGACGRPLSFRTSALSRRDCQICWNWGRERYGQLAEGESLLCWRFPSWMPPNVFGAEPSRQGGAKPPLRFIVRVARGRNPRDVTVRTNQKGISRWSARRRRSTSSIIEVDRHPLPASPASVAVEVVGAAHL
jgi:hypothetical protein